MGNDLRQMTLPDRRPGTVLKDEGPAAAVLTRLDLPGGPVVLKEWPPRGGMLLRLWARTAIRREIAHYRLLEGVPGVPRLLGRHGENGFVIEFVDAEPLTRRLPPERRRAAIDGLERVMRRLHERRFVHLDLHQKRNTLVDGEGRVWLIDLGQGIDCSRGLLRRLLFPFLRRVDENAVRKFRARYAPETLAEPIRAEWIERYGRRRRRWWSEAMRRLKERSLERADGV